MIIEQQEIDTQGRDRAPEYSAYHTAKRRCTSLKCAGFKSYGGRGIQFRFTSFQEFIQDIGFKPTPRHTLDRIDNDGHYEKGNVRWATRAIQARNRTITRCVTMDGETKSFAEWCEIYNVPYKRASSRFYRREPLSEVFRFDIRPPGLTRLTREQVYEIRFTLAEERSCKLAKQFDVSPAAICLIRKGITWKEVTKCRD